MGSTSAWRDRTPQGDQKKREWIGFCSQIILESPGGFQEVEEKGKKIQSKVDTPGKMRNDQADGYCYPVTFPLLGFKYLLMFAHIF